MKVSSRVIALLSLAGILFSTTTFSESLERVKRHSHYNGNEIEVRLAPERTVNGLKFKPAVYVSSDKEKPLEPFGNEISGTKPIINFEITDVAGAQDLECELTKIDKKTKEEMKIKDWEKRGSGDVCKGQSEEDGNTLILPKKVQKVFVSKRVRGDSIKDAHIACVKSQLEEIQKSEIFKLYYYEKSMVQILAVDYSNSKGKKLERWSSDGGHSEYYPSVGESHFSGELTVIIDQNGKCQKISGKDLDKGIVNWMTKKAVDFVEQKDIDNLKDRLVKAKEEESRKEKEKTESAKDSKDSKGDDSSQK